MNLENSVFVNKSIKFIETDNWNIKNFNLVENNI